jgi:hypothetical protein
MPKRLGSSDPPVISQRRFEPSRVEQQLWSEAYGCLVPERRWPLAQSASAMSCGKKPAREICPMSYSQEGNCA